LEGFILTILALIELIQVSGLIIVILFLGVLYTYIDMFKLS